MRTAWLGILPLTWAAGALADSGSGAVSSTAVVSAVCEVSAQGFNATYQPLVAHAVAPLDVTASVTTTCAATSAATVTLGQGTYADTASSDSSPVRRLSNGQATPAYLRYHLYQDPARTIIWGNTTTTGLTTIGTGSPVTTTVYGRLPRGQNQPPGVYQDVVIVGVNF